MSDNLQPLGEFYGFRRKNGPPGVRNHTAIISLSGLEHAHARSLAGRFPDCVFLATTFGRGHVGKDKVFQGQMMRALATHPNIGGAVILGPDRGLVDPVRTAMIEAGRLAEGVSLDQVGEDGFELTERAARALANIHDNLSNANRVACPVSDLAIAIECGHSGASSGIVANPLVGAFSVALVKSGGRSLFSETLEWTGAESVLVDRAARPEIASAILAALKTRHDMARAAGHKFGEGNPGPQNHAGGITTLEEKSLGAIAKGGVQRIEGLLSEGEALPDAPGLYLMDTPCFSPESITSMIASGAQMVLFTTDQGNPYSSAVAPTVKVTANPRAAKLVRQIDYDASAAFSGSATLADLLPDLVKTVLGVASGIPTKAEEAGLGTESISRLGPSI